jgi:hypothetical protein
MNRKLFAVATLVAALAGVRVPANADVVFFYHQVYQPVPIYALAPAPMLAFDPGARYTSAYDIQGVITSAVPYHLTVRIHDQYYPVLEHDGTIINPTGTTLAPAMIINIAGFWDRNGVFHANRIDVLRY